MMMCQTLCAVTGKNVRDIATVAKQQGITTIRTHGDGIVVDDGIFRRKDLDLLSRQSGSK